MKHIEAVFHQPDRTETGKKNKIATFTNIFKILVLSDCCCFVSDISNESGKDGFPSPNQLVEFVFCF